MKRTKFSLIIVFLIASIFFCIEIAFISFFQRHPNIFLILGLLYLWSPGIVALVFSRKEKIQLPVFTRLNKFFYFIPVVTLGISSVAFLLTISFMGVLDLNPVLQNLSGAKTFWGILNIFFNTYVLLTILFSFFFLGGEIFWRGYLWEKWKGNGPLKAMGFTAIAWSLWQIPLSSFAFLYQIPLFLLSILMVFIINIFLTPILTFFRIKGKMIFSAAAFYSSLMAGFMFYLMLFPALKITHLSMYGGFTLLGLIIFFFLFKLYSPATWKKDA